jgi:glycosyltransferase involved in cell wall biosynthesis
VVVYSASEEAAAAAAALSAETGLAVSVLPPSPWTTIADVMGRARVALAVNVTDGTPNTMLEAMIMGAFPVQSDTISTREWLRNGENGFLVPPEEPEAVAAALREALTNDALVDRAMAVNERLTEQVGRDVVQPRIVRMYEEAARQAPEPGR